MLKIRLQGTLKDIENAYSAVYEESEETGIL